MKKALALLLVLVMCLSLVACGNSEPTPPEIPEGLEFCVGDVWHDYHYYLELFPDGYAKYGEYAKVIDVYYWRNLALVEGKDGIVCAQVEIYSEGKDGKTFTATFYSDPTGYNWAEIEGQKLYTMGDEPASPETTIPETTVPETTVPETTVPETTVPETTVEPEPVYETIEITIDNWQEYFEFRLGEGNWQEDAFGEATRYVNVFSFVIKEEYADVANPNTIDIALCYSYKNQYRYYEADFEAKSFTLGEKVSEELLGGHRIREGVSDAKSMTRMEYTVWYIECFKDSSAYVDVNGDYIVDWVDTLDIDRIQGTIEIQTN